MCGVTGAGSVANRRRGSRSDCSVPSKSSWTAAVFGAFDSLRLQRFLALPCVAERPAAPLTARVRALARLRRRSGADQPQKAAARLPPLPSRHRRVRPDRQRDRAVDLDGAERGRRAEVPRCHGCWRSRTRRAPVFGRSPSRLLRRLGHGRASEASSRGVRGPRAADRRGCRARRPRSDDQACPRHHRPGADRRSGRSNPDGSTSRARRQRRGAALLPPVRGGAPARPRGGTGGGHQGDVPTSSGPPHPTARRYRARTWHPSPKWPFVGRDLELDQLNQAWNTAREGRAHLVLVSGEPGIGKSRLALELGRRVRAEGHVVASARAYEAAGRLPWGPVVDLLRSDALRSHIDTLGTVWRAELARLLPELLEASPPPAPSRSGDLAQRHRLFDAVSRAIVGDRPRLLIIDDLQWCDAETIELIGFVVRSGQTAPVLIVGTVRSEEIPEHHPLVGLVDALGHDQAVTTVPLDRLDEATTATLAARLRNAEEIDPELAARLWAETEGNPLFVIEVLRAGVSPEGRQAALTPTMRAVLGARLGQLPDGARRLAEVAAVIGRSFSVGLLVSATGIGEPELVDDLDELWRRRIIRDQGLTYDFSHDKLRAVALEMLSPARRRQLHRAVAEAIAVEFGHDLDAASPQLAAHYDQAGMVQPAIDAYRVAGARAVAVSALDEAVTMFRRALSLLAELPPSPGRDALELDIRIALGSPLVALEGYGSHGAHQLYERALSLCRTAPPSRGPPDSPRSRPRPAAGLPLRRVQRARPGARRP